MTEPLKDDFRFWHEVLDRFETRSFIAIILVLSMVGLTYILALRIPESDAFKILLGAMLTVGFASAIGWYFNSSIGSEKKDAAQQKVTEKLAEALPAAGVSLVGLPGSATVTTTTTTSTEEPKK